VAFLTATILQNESSWSYVSWQPAIGNTSDFTTWLGTIVTRVSNHTKWRVGATLYATSDTLLQAILQEAELCLGQFYLLLASAALADTSDDASLVPFLQSGPKILEDAYAYKRRYDEILAPYDQTLGRPNYAAPGATATTGVDPSLPSFDAEIAFEEPGAR
jgi:hypothetical protein